MAIITLKDRLIAFLLRKTSFHNPRIGHPFQLKSVLIGVKRFEFRILLYHIITEYQTIYRFSI